MRKSRWSLIVLSLSLSLSLLGCHLGYHVEVRQKPELDPRTPHPSLAKVCVLRPQTFGALAAFQHYDNGRLVGVSRFVTCHAPLHPTAPGRGNLPTGHHAIVSFDFML